MDNNQTNVVNYFLDNEQSHHKDTVKSTSSAPIKKVVPFDLGVSTKGTKNESSVGELPTKQMKVASSQFPSEPPPPKLDNPYLPYSTIAMGRTTPLASSQPNGFFYNQKLPYRGDMYSMYLAQETVAPNPTMAVSFKALQPNSYIFYPSYGQPCYPPVPQNQQSTPILSPYFNQGQYSHFSPQCQVNQSAPAGSFSQPPNSVVPNSSLQPIPKIPSSSTGTDKTSSQMSVPLEEYREMKLTRDRAAARLRRMRKKASIETTEMRIDMLKAHINILQNAVISENRQGMFIPFDLGDSLLFSHEERSSQFQFLLSVWKELVQRQKSIHTILSLLMWTLIPDNASAPQEANRHRLQDLLQLSDTQKKQLHSIIQALELLKQRLDVTSLCLLSLGIHANVLLNPMIDKGNETFTSILTATQIQKLHSFFRVNANTISQLPITPPGSVPETDIPSGLQFKFI